MNSIIKLTSGETRVAEIIHQDEKITSVLEPLSLEITESGDGRPMMVAFCWVPLTKKINMINISTNHVIAVSECDESISQYYEKSLAVFKNDEEKLRELYEMGDDGEIHVSEETVADPWMEKFGQPVELSANTVH